MNICMFILSVKYVFIEFSRHLIKIYLIYTHTSFSFVSLKNKVNVNIGFNRMGKELISVIISIVYCSYACE